MTVQLNDQKKASMTNGDEGQTAQNRDMVRVDPETAALLEASMQGSVRARQIVLDRFDAAQLLLGRLGYNTGEEAGFYGPVTRNSLAQFQKDNGLPVDGTITKDTIEVLFWYARVLTVA
jgi:murein L,D-transpeptidase YcbB/YkuD